MMDEKKKLKQEKLAKTVGGKWDGNHICGICGAEMKFDRTQEGAFPAVYRCPKCGNIEVFPS